MTLMTRLLALAILVLPGCAAKDPLVAAYGPDREYTVESGRWLRDARLADVPEGAGKYTTLEGGQLVTVVSGTQDVLFFSRKHEAGELRVWIALEGGAVVDGVLWAREFSGESVWYVGAGAKGTAAIARREGRTIEGTLDVTFEGRRESARGGVTGPLVFRFSGPFDAEASAPK